MDRGRNGRNSRDPLRRGHPQPRARQRAFLIGATPRRAGSEPSCASCCARPAWRWPGRWCSAATGRIPTATSGEGKLDEVKARRRGVGRQPRGLRRRAAAAPGAQPRAGARRAGDRPHGDHPRHLRRPRRLGRGQAPGGAGPARVQPRPHARALDPPRAARSGPHGRRHRHPRPGRVPDRDRPPAGARPHLGAAAPPAPHQGHARHDARGARARRPADAWRWPATPTPASPRC